MKYVILSTESFFPIPEGCEDVEKFKEGIALALMQKEPLMIMSGAMKFGVELYDTDSE